MEDEICTGFETCHMHFRNDGAVNVPGCTYRATYVGSLAVYTIMGYGPGTVEQMDKAAELSFAIQLASDGPEKDGLIKEASDFMTSIQRPYSLVVYVGVGALSDAHISQTEDPDDDVIDTMHARGGETMDLLHSEVVQLVKRGMYGLI